MKNALPPILFCLLALDHARKTKLRWNRKPKTHSHGKDAIEYLEGSTKHKDKSFADPMVRHQEGSERGKQEGVELLTLDNGKLEITVIPTRGMGILDIRMGDLRWAGTRPSRKSSTLLTYSSRAGADLDGWRVSMNGWCVADSNSPDTREPINSSTTPEEPPFDPHPPWQNPKHPGIRLPNQRRPEPPHRIRISGTVYEKFFYGPKLKAGDRNIHRPRFGYLSNIRQAHKRRFIRSRISAHLPWQLRVLHS